MRTKQQKTAQTTVTRPTIYPKKYAHSFCFAVLCCGSTLTDFPISIRLTSLALWQSNDCPSASKATLMNMDKYFMWIHYERLHNHNKAKHNKTVCIFLGIYCTSKQYRYFRFDDDNKTKYICARHHHKRNGIHVAETHSPHILYINDWDDNDDILSIWLLGTKFIVISIAIKLLFNETKRWMLSAKGRLYCLGLNLLRKSKINRHISWRLLVWPWITTLHILNMRRYL